MSTTEPPTTETPSPPPAGPPPQRPWSSRLRSRGFVIGAAIVAVVIVGGVVAALLIPRPGPDRDDWFGPGFGPGAGRGDWVDEGRPGPVGPGGPWREGPMRGGPDEWVGEGPMSLGDDPVVAGTVVSAGEGTLVVAVDGGAQRTLRTDGDTRVLGEDNSAIGDLEAGERVVVRVEGSGDAAGAVTVFTPQAHVTGTVTALNGDIATVTAIDGLTVTADVSGLSQRPTVGDVVMLTGVASDANTIRADGVRILPRAS